MSAQKAALVAPGPVPLPEAVRLAMAGQLIHHRTPAFEAIMREVGQGLGWLYQTQQDVLVLTGSGSTGMEAALVNFARSDAPVVCVGGGKFALRWAEVARAYGVEVVLLEVPWGQAASPEALGELLEAHPNTAAVTITANETSTGVHHPIEALCAVVRERSEALLLVDGITAVGVQDLGMDALGIDALVTGSQKVYAVPPGLAFVGVSERAWSRLGDLPRYGLDLARERARQCDGQTAFSPAISLIFGLQAALRLLREEGLEALWGRHARCAQATRAGVAALGLELFSAAPCNAVTAVRVPDGLDGVALATRCLELGAVIAGGQSHLKGKILRIGHLGSHRRADVIHALSTLELALESMGHPVAFGKGVGAALARFSAS